MVASPVLRGKITGPIRDQLLKLDTNFLEEEQIKYPHHRAAIYERFTKVDHVVNAVGSCTSPAIRAAMALEAHSQSENNKLNLITDPICIPPTLK